MPQPLLLLFWLLVLAAPEAEKSRLSDAVTEKKVT